MHQNNFSLGPSKMEENIGYVQLLVFKKNHASTTITTIWQTAEKQEKLILIRFCAYFSLLLSMFCIGIINYVTATTLSQVTYFENLSVYQKS